MVCEDRLPKTGQQRVLLAQGDPFDQPIVKKLQRDARASRERLDEEFRAQTIQTDGRGDVSG